MSPVYHERHVCPGAVCLVTGATVVDTDADVDVDDDVDVDIAAAAFLASADEFLLYK